MGKRYLLDSNIIIDYIANNIPEKSKLWLDQIIDDEINISIITKIEVLSFNPDCEDNYQILLDFFYSSNVIDLSFEIANTTIITRQKRKIKLPDAIIAATAITGGFELITRNSKDFRNIENLELINPFDIQ